MTTSKLVRGWYSSIALGALLVFGSAWVGGCASQPAEVAPQATGHLTALRDSLITAKAQVQAASNAAKDLINQPRQDLTPQMERLKNNVAALNATRAETRGQAEAFQQSSDEYFKKWDDLLKDMSADTAEKGQERQAAARESVQRLRKDIDDVRTEVRPFMAELNEASKYLSTDTTSSGLKIITPKLQSAVDRQPAIMKAIDRLVADIDAVRAGK